MHRLPTSTVTGSSLPVWPAAGLTMTRSNETSRGKTLILGPIRNNLLSLLSQNRTDLQRRRGRRSGERKLTKNTKKTQLTLLLTGQRRTRKREILSLWTCRSGESECNWTALWLAQCKTLEIGSDPLSLPPPASHNPPLLFTFSSHQPAGHQHLDGRLILPRSNSNFSVFPQIQTIFSCHFFLPWIFIYPVLGIRRKEKTFSRSFRKFTHVNTVWTVGFILKNSPLFFSLSSSFFARDTTVSIGAWNRRMRKPASLLLF